MSSYKVLANGTPVDFEVFNTIFSNEKELEKATPSVQINRNNSYTRTSNVDHKMRVIGGKVNVGGFKGSKTVAIKFRATHSGGLPPVVVATVDSSSAIITTVNSISNTGANITLHSLASGTVKATTINWVAIIEIPQSTT